MSDLTMGPADLGHLLADTGSPGPWHWLVILIGAALLAQALAASGGEMVRPSARLARPPIVRVARKGE